MSDIADLSDADLVTKNWNDLSAMLTTNPLPPEPSPTLFEALPPEFLQPICAAHAAGCASAMGNNSHPDIPEAAAAPALLAYFNHGMQHPLQQRIASMRPPDVYVNPAVPAGAVKGKEPDTFDGHNRDLYSAFVLQLALLFSNNPRRYADDASKIRAAGSYLRGHALSWFDPHCDKATGAVSWATYREFVDALKVAYDDPDRRSTAEHKLLKLRQGGKTASAYYSEFMTYAAVLSLDDATKISFFHRGVNDDLSVALSYQLNPPMEFAQFAQMCITLDNQARMRKTTPRWIAPSLSSPQAPPNPVAASNGDPMDLSQASHARGPLSAEEKKHRLENNLCSYCGGAGHYANSCPHRRRATPFVSQP